MKNKIKALRNNLDLLLSSLLFIRNHWGLLLTLGLISAFGRVIQLGGFGEISTQADMVLEVIIETSRVILFLYVLGAANMKRGAHLIKRLFSGKINLKANWTTITQKLKSQWLIISVNFLGFMILAGTINFLIDQLAYQTCLLLSLQHQGFLVYTSSEWTLLLFFKNISVIPFTVVFETLFLFWITDKHKDFSALFVRNAP